MSAILCSGYDINNLFPLQTGNSLEVKLGNQIATYTVNSFTNAPVGNYWIVGVTYVSGTVSVSPVTCHAQNLFCFDTTPQPGISPLPTGTNTPTPSATPRSTVTPTISSTNTPTQTVTPSSSVPVETTISLFTSITDGSSFTGFTSMGNITNVNSAICDKIANDWNFGGSLHKMNTSTLQVGTVIRRFSDNNLVQNSILVNQIPQGPTIVGSDYWFIQTDSNGVVISYIQMSDCVETPTPTPTLSATVTPTNTPTPSITSSVTPTLTVTPTPTTSAVVITGDTFSESFVQSQAPTTAVETAWNTFRASLTGTTYTSFTWSSTNGNSITVSDPTLVQVLADSLRTATITGVTINDVVWRVGTGCGTPKIGGVAVEFSNIASCSASSTYALRPMINNQNWGGTNQSTVGAPSQTITLTFF